MTCEGSITGYRSKPAPVATPKVKGKTLKIFLIDPKTRGVDADWPKGFRVSHFAPSCVDFTCFRTIKRNNFSSSTLRVAAGGGFKR